MIKHQLKYRSSRITGLLFFFISALQPALAQGPSDELFLLQGRILSADSLLPIQNAHVISKFNRWGTISDNKGDFAMLVNRKDSLLITSVGFSQLILFLNDSVQHSPPPFRIYMTKDTIMMNEFIIHAFWDYTTFKQIIINMKPLDFDFTRVDFEENLLLSLPMTGAGISGPVGLLYNYFNKEERLKRHLLKNRKRYNELMIQMGRPQDTIPAIPEHMQAWPR
ncbi:MAG: hypothetical protein L3J31_00890 [Bacteroidales bacterium]|nr:hypothetical protein [Bacteroidales bacterium]